MKLFSRNERGMETIETETLPLKSATVKIYGVDSMVYPVGFTYHAHYESRNSRGIPFTLTTNLILVQRKETGRRMALDTLIKGLKEHNRDTSEIW